MKPRVACVGAACCAVLATATPVCAASMFDQTLRSDLVPWTGFYVGLTEGAGWSKAQHTGIATGDSALFVQTGSVIGGTAGYNWQMGLLLIGVEGDASYAKLEGQTSANCPGYCFSNIQAVGTLRTRIGLAWHDLLPYVTVGVATVLLNSGQSAGSATDWEPGWSYGGGVEFRYLPNWSLRLEFLHTRMNDIVYSVPGLAGTIHPDVNQHDLNLVRLGISYYPDWGPFAHK